MAIEVIYQVDELESVQVSRRLEQATEIRTGIRLTK